MGVGISDDPRPFHNFHPSRQTTLQRADSIFDCLLWDAHQDSHCRLPVTEATFKAKGRVKSHGLPFLLLFLSNGVFKLLSLAIIITCLRKIALVLFFVVAIGFHGLNVLRRRASCCHKHLAGEEFGEYHHTTLQVKGDSRATKRQKMKSCLLHNIIWGIFYVIILTNLVTAANSNLDSLNYTVTDFSNNDTEQYQSMSRVQSARISKRPGLIENLPLLNGLFIGILSSLATNAVL